MRGFLVLCLTLAGSLASAPDAAAQQHFPVSTEASLGFRVGHGGSYVNHGGAALDVVLGYRLRGTSAGPLILGLNLGAQAPVTGGDACLLIDSPGKCAPDFPVFFSGGALVGVQRGSSARTASSRILAGPTYYHTMDRGGALALQARADVSTPPWMHTAIVASLRHSVLPSFRGEALGITSFGIGLRIQ